MPTYTRSRPNSHIQPLPLYAILLTLPPIHIEFFTYLDEQLEKINSFYLEREKEAQSRSKALDIQLRELEDHRKIFFEAYPNNGPSWSETLKFNLQFLPGSPPLTGQKPATVAALRLGLLAPTIGKVKLGVSNRDTAVSEIELSPKAIVEENEIRQVDSETATVTAAKNSGTPTFAYRARLDPEEYKYARKKLKRAVQEHYRGLEVLNNYRILNITGFRKALKKYQKATKIPAQQAYMKEKVETSAFSSGVAVGVMLKQVEELFAARFGRGDKKWAMAQLRAEKRHRSYHSSALRSGIALGLALPALVSGVYQSFQPERRAQIPAWEALLFIYSICLVPVLFSLLVGVNLWIWSNARINYVFIFELDIRTRLGHCEYFELPAILFATLAYAFWLSFSHIGVPTIWPLAWIVFALVVVLHPIPVLYKSSRWWLVRSVGKLLVSGVHPVEFIDFWMGDQFCSLGFTLSNLYFTSCAYAYNFPSTVWEQCGTQSQVGWSMSFVLTMLPLLARMIQSVRRYYDSDLSIHLINAGKYGSGIIYYFFFFLWRYHGARNGGYLVPFCLFGTFYSTYSCTWDFLMDWSLFKRRSRYPLLRSDLVYTNALPLYYFAMISNVMIKFIWIFYIPARGPTMILRTFISGMLEMLRRWQWNFFRLENEHIGNMDQYRVTREMPLPYQIDETARSDDGDEDSVARRRWPHWQQSQSPDVQSVYDDDESNV